MKEATVLERRTLVPTAEVSRTAEALGCSRLRLLAWRNGGRDAALTRSIRGSRVRVVGRGSRKLGEGAFPFCHIVARELGITPGHVHRVAKGERYSPRLLAHYLKRRAELEASAQGAN